jgi:ribosome maturation factor RimP
MAGLAERVRALVEPLLAAQGLEVFDVEHAGAQIRVTVERPGGVDLDALSAATRTVSHALDDLDPIPGRYTLEVSSPGLERTLRTPAHFAGAIGETVKVKTLPTTEGERRVTGELLAADDDGIAVHTTDGDRHLRYDEIERARTVFEWGPAPRPDKRAGTR